DHCCAEERQQSEDDDRVPLAVGSAAGPRQVEARGWWAVRPATKRLVTPSKLRSIIGGSRWRRIAAGPPTELATNHHGPGHRVWQSRVRRGDVCAFVCVVGLLAGCARSHPPPATSTLRWG